MKTTMKTTMKKRFVIASALCLLALLGNACGGSGSSGDSAGSDSSTTSTAPGAGTSIVNVWVGPPADTTKLPIGTSKVTLTGPTADGLYACNGGLPNGGGAHAAGPWLDEAAGTWDLSKKISVEGDVAWPMASYSEVIDGDTRLITSNGLPVDEHTGTFPIASNDPAYAYDRNPNRIASNDVKVSLSMTPTTAAAPKGLGKGRIGIMKNGVSMFAPLDERNRDAVAYETQDSCDGHPQQSSVYHYHDVPSCLRNAAMGPSTVVGFAYDGFPIVVERNAAGELPTNADLDACHGRSSPIELDGKVVDSYHYSETYEFPYFVGCFTGTPIS